MQDSPSTSNGKENRFNEIVGMLCGIPTESIIAYASPCVRNSHGFDILNVLLADEQVSPAKAMAAIEQVEREIEKEGLTNEIYLLSDEFKRTPLSRGTTFRQVCQELKTLASEAFV